MMLCNLGINCNRFSYKKEKVNHRDCQRIITCSYHSLQYFREIIGFRVPKKRDALNKLIDKPRQVIHNRNCDPVTDKIDIGVIDLYDITIDSPDHLFIANGLLVHNCHSFGAEKFGSVAPRFSAEYMCGTSGTIYRLDNCEKVFKAVLGDVLVKANTINRVHPKIYVRIPPSSGKMVSSSMEKPQLISHISRDIGRNNFIANDVVKAVKAGRYPIVMRERIEILEKIDLCIKKIDKSITTGYYIGGKKEEELKIASAQAVVLTTVQMMKEGINLPIRDTLMLVTPQSLVEQAVGRVCRKLPEKKTPFVLDYVDVDIKKFKGSFVSRYKLYKSLGWEVNGAEKVGL
jgi:superfamily II DNA or RNA helicase